MAITSIGSGSAAVLLSIGGTAQQQITSVVVPRVPGGSVPAGQASRLVQLADVNSASLPGGVLTEIVGPGGERRFEIRDDLNDQIAAIYQTQDSVISGCTYSGGVLSYTPGALIGPGLPGCSSVTPGLHPVSFIHPVLGSVNDSFFIAYDTSIVNVLVYTKLAAVFKPYMFEIRIDGVKVFEHAIAAGDAVTVDFTDSTATVTVNGTVYNAGASTATPVVSGSTHFIAVIPGGGHGFDITVSLPAGATGLLPDETAARIAADAALQDQIDDVQTLAEVNQLNITGKADQIDLDALQTTVSGQGITLASKADQTALTALTAVVSGKATPADISAAIAALVDGAPDALNTLAELATALAGDQAQISDLLAALALRVRVDAIQSLTLAQQLQARQNINAEQVGVAAGLVAAITPASIGAATAVQGAKADTALQSGDVAPVALSGQYSALTGLPTIPGLSSATPEAPTTGGTAGMATTAARGDHAHPLPTAAQITAAVLTGLATGSATAIAAADSILQALAKLQAQASVNATNIATNGSLLAPVPRKIGPSWYQSGGWYDVEYPKQVGVSAGAVTLGVVTFIPRQILEAVTFTSLAFYCSTGAAGATGYAGIYSDNNGEPGTLLASISADCSTSGTKTGAVSLTLTAGQIVWDAFLLVGGAAQVYKYSVTRALPQQTLGAGANNITYRIISGQSALPAIPPATAFGQSTYIVRTLLQAQ